jgi:hypothetical protein
LTKQEFIDKYEAKRPGAIEGEAEAVWDSIHKICAGANNFSNLDNLIEVK